MGIGFKGSMAECVPYAGRVRAVTADSPRPALYALHALQLFVPNGGTGVRGVAEVEPVPWDATALPEPVLECADEGDERGQLGESLEESAPTDVHLDHDPVRAADLGHDFLDPA